VGVKKVIILIYIEFFKISPNFIKFLHYEYKLNRALLRRIFRHWSFPKVIVEKNIYLRNLFYDIVEKNAIVRYIKLFLNLS